jgi:arsenate reductase (glutaredoxin)
MTDAPAPDAGTTTIFHNPSCSKSRGALAILEERSIDHGVVNYLTTPPSRAELESIIAILIDPVSDLVRRSDPAFTELGLDPSGYHQAEDVIDLLIAHPELMQRPIVVRGGKAVIARPSERVDLVLP